MRWLILFVSSLRLFAGPFDEIVPSQADEIAALNADLVVEGFVSVASGQLSLSETDLCVRGAADLLLQRTYIPPHILGRYHDKESEDWLDLGKALRQLNAKGWVVLPHLWAGMNQHSPYFQVRDPQGTVLEFEIRGNRGELKTAGFGCSNLRRSEPCAEADIRNIEFWVEGEEIRIVWPNGTQRIYRFQWAGFYRLDRELLPNGKAIRYAYQGQTLARISSTDRSGKHVYAAIECIGKHHYRSSDGREVQLFYETREIKGKHKHKHYEEHVRFQFPVLTHALNPVYSNKAGYNERTLLTSYDAKSYPISCTYWQEKKVPCRIRTFSTPSGTTSFVYDPPISGKKGGSTTVTHPNRSQTIYRFNVLFLLSAIENRFEGELYNQKLFFYDSKQHIAKIETKDGQGHPLLVKRYECDSCGNPILEIWEGDFGVHTIRRAFSKNRLVKEEFADGLSYEYTYLGETRLPVSKTTFCEGVQVRKTTYAYDEACNLIEEAKVGKTVITHLLYQSGPHLHRPEWKIERDWAKNLLHKTRFSYDRFGNCVEEEHYGSDGCFAYRTTRLYDSCGNLLEETNPLGCAASYEYDARGRNIREVPFSGTIAIQRTFDAKGRLTLLQEGDHRTRFAYNSSDELIQKTNYLGLETCYQIHPVHGKPTRIEEEPTLLEITYDSFGREILRKDAYGAATATEPNGYGDPLIITRPDGGKETFSYAPNGNLLTQTDPDGLTTSYSYDPLRRVLSKTMGTRRTCYVYDAYDLFEETDPLGAVTAYQYNPFGQLIEKTRGERTCRFSYDPLGFLSKEENGSRRTSYQNDVQGRVLAKSVDGRLNTLYAYDAAGNLSSITKKATTHYSYDPYDRLIETLQPDGSKTTIFYEEKNGLLIQTTVDPKGAKRIETFNAHGLVLKKEVPGYLLEEFSYDRALRLATQDRIAFTYTLEGRLSSRTEVGQRKTSWTYTSGGKVRTKTKPDGTVLAYEYTPDGDLARVGSREFHYDALGRRIGGTGFSRTLDLFGNITKETFATGLTVETTVDDSDRPLVRILPDQSRILYTYDGPFLTQVSRMDPAGHILYTHTYDQFDPDGQVLSETGAFTTTFAYDPLGRRISQTNPYFTEELGYDPSGNLIRNGAHTYAYDDADQLIASEGEFAHQYDAGYNRRVPAADELNQIEGLTYDANGNITFQGFVFDEFDQLVRTHDEAILYDALGRRLQKGEASYLYFGNEEVGSYESGQPKELKIPGVAVEIDNSPYFPIADVQGTIHLLVDPATSQIAQENQCDPFGAGLTAAIPYAYAGKRYDPKTGLVYFGKRYYIPEIGRWLTPDPLGPIDHSNLYQYVFNNPFRYQDPTGEFAFAIPLVIWGAELALPAISALIYGAAAGAAVYGGYKIGEAIYNYTESERRRSSDESGSPPYRGDELPLDESRSPGKEFEWKGKGKPGSSRGNWVRGDQKDGQEKLHPDLDHGPPIGPHWDYESPAFPKPGVRLYPDGTWEYKIR